MTDNNNAQPLAVRGGWCLRGYGGGKSGAGGSGPVESPDSLHSTSYARVLDLVSEGEIAGPVDGLRSIYLDNTPLQNADGSMNFEGVKADFRAGTQDQDVIAGFPAAESMAAVGAELKSGTPWVRSVSNLNLSAVRLTLGVNGLSKADTATGNINGYAIDYAIDLQTDGGAWVELVNATMSGKAQQSYRRTHRIDLPEAKTGWTVRVRRLTPNANSTAVSDTMVVDSIGEIIDAKLRYPMSALVGLQVDASQFKSIPTRCYHLRGRIIRVPSNYDPQTRVYAGIWDGTFKVAWTNNPAWIFYDLATNERYGLGQRIPAAWINKWALYRIGAYCDELVPDGRGGQEPRFTCNVYLQKRGDATRVLQDLCGVFRGMAYWAAGAVVPVADMPRDPVYTYTQANVIGGRFSYTGSRLKDRNTVALVSYNDMTDMGRQKVVYVQDDESVARYGVRQVEISAFGCTSEAQARRVGQWALLTARRETDSVSFSVGLDGTLCAPGQVIRVADSARAGRRLGGRVKSATATDVALDADTAVAAGDTLTVILGSGVAQSRRVASSRVQDGVRHVTVAPAFDAAPSPESAWAIDARDLATQLYTVVGITEGEGLTFDVTAVQHEPGKFAAIDADVQLPERPTCVVPAQVLPTPMGIAVQARSITSDDGALNTTVVVSWQAVAGAAYYDVEWRRSQSDWVRMPRTPTRSVDITNAYSGDYIVRVRALSVIETVSAWAYSDVTPVAAKALPPRNYDTFVVSERDGGMRQFSFAYTSVKPPADLAGAEIRYIAGTPASIDWQQMRPLDDGGYYTSGFESSRPEAGLWTFALRARNRSGVLSDGMLIYRIELLENFGEGYVPDLTPPPAPTGVEVTSALASVVVSWKVPDYIEGNGHQTTRIYAVEVTAQAPNPGRGAARVVAEARGPVTSFAAALGTSWRLWLVNLSNDGVESSAAAGPFNVTVGKIGNSDLGQAIVEAGNLAKGSVGAPQLADKSIDATKFAAGTEPVSIVSGSTLPTTKTTSTIVFGGKLYRWDGSKYTAAVPATDLTGTVLEAQLADNAVTVKKIAAGAVDEGKLAQGAVTAKAIATGAIDATKFASGLEPVGIVSGSTLPTVKTTATIVFGGKLYRWDGSKYTAAVPATDLTGTVLESQLADNAVTVKKIAAGAVDEGKLAQGAVTAKAIATGAIDATKFANGVEPVGIVSGSTLPAAKTTSAIVFGGKLYRWDGSKYTATVPAVDLTGQLTDAQLAAISAAKLTGQIVSTQITDGAISTPKLAAGSVTAAAIAVGAIVADKLAANSVTATAIATGAVTTAKLAAGAVTADTIAASAITSAKIATGAVTATQIASQAITASKLAITDTSAINIDPMFEDASFWGNSNIQVKPIADGAVGPNAWYTSKSSNSIINNNKFLIDASKTYLFEFWCRALDETNGYAFAAARFFDGNGVVIPAVSGSGWPVANNAAGNYYWPKYGSGAAPTSTKWTRHAITVGPNGEAKIPAGSVSCTLGAYMNYLATTPVEVQCNMLRVTEMSRGELIVDGAITATKIAAFAITAGKIAAGTITAIELATGAVIADKIGANAVTAAAIAVGAITAEKLAANSVVAGKIATDAVTTNTIAANAITTVKVAAGAITATQIAAQAITAKHLVVADWANLVPDPDFANLSDGSWYSSGIATMARYSGSEGVGVLVAKGGANESQVTVNTENWRSNADQNFIPVFGGEKLRCTCTITLKSGSVSGAASVGLHMGFIDKDGAVATTGIGTYATRLQLNEPVVLNSEWTVSANTRGVRFRIIWPADVGSAGASIAFTNISVRRMNTAEMIVDGSITATKIATGAITAGKVAAGTITAIELATGAVIADKIGANAVTAAAIAVGAITAEKLAANSVVAGKIATDAVTTNTIAANAITTVKVAAGAITATQIAAQAITAKHLVVADWANLVPDPDFANLSDGSWYITGNASASRYIGDEGVGVLLSAQSGTTSSVSVQPENWRNNNSCNFIPVKAGDKIRCTCTITRKAGSNGSYSFGLSGGYITAAGAVGIFSPGTQTTSAEIDKPLNVSAEYTVPAGYVGVRFRVLINADAAGSGSSIAVTNISVRRMNTAELIVDGAVTATKLAANAIAVGTAAIQDGAIVNAMIGNLSADKITAGTLAAARIASGSIDTTKLAANSVTATQIAVNAITSDKIQANAIVAGKIAVGAVTANAIATGAVTADKISVTELSAVAANLGTVTAGRIQNKDSTSFWDLNAAGAMRMLQLGNDLSYSDSEGLKINKLNVIGNEQIADASVDTLKVAGGSITTTQYMATGVTPFSSSYLQGTRKYKCTSNRLSVSMPAGSTGVVINAFVMASAVQGMDSDFPRPMNISVIRVDGDGVELKKLASGDIIFSNSGKGYFYYANGALSGVDTDPDTVNSSYYVIEMQTSGTNFTFNCESAMLTAVGGKR